MKKKLLKFVLASLFLFLPAVSYGQLITIAITANVTNVSDSYNLLEGKVSVGSTITGTYTYDTSTPDTNPASETGEYLHYATPYGITLTVDGITFISDPQNTKFGIGLTNAEPGYLFNDSYGIRSFYNSPVLNGVQVDSISWALGDYGNTAISSTTLPTAAPVLSDWDYGVFSITGGNGIPCDKTFGISANVVSAVLVPEPLSVLLFGFGLLVLRKIKITRI